MGILNVDIDDGTISEEEANRIDDDAALYLDRFKDPFNSWQVPLIPSNNLF